MRVLRRWVIMPAALALFWAWIVFAGAPGKEGVRWYELTMASQKVGYLKFETAMLSSAGRSLVKTPQESRMVLNRMESRVELRVGVVYEEDGDGRLLRFRAETAASNRTMETKGEVAEGTIILTTRVGESVQTQKIPADSPLVGPSGIRTATTPLWEGSTASVRFAMFSVEFSRVHHVTRTAELRENLETGTGTIPCLRLKETCAEMPIARILWVDRDGFEVKTSDPSPFGELQSLLSTEAASDLASSGRIPEEQYQNTIIRSNVRVGQARLIESMILKLKHRRPELGWPAFDGPGQKVLERTHQSIVLKIDRGDASMERAPGPPLKEDLAPNAYFDSEDPAVRDAVREAIGEERDVLRKALRLKRWVSEHMAFDLGIAFAPSRELVRDRRGTCVGYAGLLATMARAAQLPARMLMGYVYIDGIWGGHAWVEMFLNGRWRPFDAAVIGPGLSDAARFAFASSNLNAGPADLLIGGQQLFGNVDVEIMDYRLGGTTVSVPLGRLPYEVSENAYINPGLGMKVVKPRNFTFTDFDKVWPDPTLLRMTGPEGQKVSILQKAWRPGQTSASLARFLVDDIISEGSANEVMILNRLACLKSAVGRAAAAVVDGTDAWVVLVEGQNGAELLHQVLSSLTLGPARAFPEDD